MTEARKIIALTNVEWSARRSPASTRCIGVCDAPNLAVEADTLDELHGLIPEATQLLMGDLLEDDELDQYVQDSGWQTVGIAPGGWQ